MSGGVVRHFRLQRPVQVERQQIEVFAQNQPGITVILLGDEQGPQRDGCFAARKTTRNQATTILTLPRPFPPGLSPNSSCTGGSAMLTVPGTTTCDGVGTRPRRLSWLPLAALVVAGASLLLSVSPAVRPVPGRDSGSFFTRPP